MKRSLIAILSLVAIAALAYFFLLRETPRAMGRVESLSAPIAVTGWTKDFLQTAGGRNIPIPGITNLPATSPALTEATSRGIEITPDGRVISLVRVHHWCGNDRISGEILRTDLSELLTYLRVGDPAIPPANPEFLCNPAGGRFDPSFGMEVSDYAGFVSWQYFKNQNP